MHIGFDAKRAYHNKTGLGYYSRTLIGLLTQHYPANEYFLFNPKPSSLFDFSGSNVHEVLPSGFFDKMLSSAWRSSWMKKDIKKNGIQLYHGLSHEIPVGIQHTNTRSVVTIHDLIHERHPEQYNPIDVKIYHKKFLNACEHANKVIAISEQTKKDIVELYEIPESKVAVSLQSANPVFQQPANDTEKNEIRRRYKLPVEFFLYVGSIIERKNLLNVCKAMYVLGDEWKIPLVVIGDGGKYKQLVKDLIAEKKIGDKIIFLSEKEEVRNDPAFKEPRTLGIIYQMAIAMIYPSFYEGFGMPVLEAILSRTPVITSNISCLPEVGGNAAYYVDPNNAEEIAAGMKKIYENASFAEEMKSKGIKYAERFAPEKYVRHMMDIYKEVLK